MKHPDFRAGRLSTRFLERYFASLEKEVAEQGEADAGSGEA